MELHCYRPVLRFYIAPEKSGQGLAIVSICPPVRVLLTKLRTGTIQHFVGTLLNLPRACARTGHKMGVSLAIARVRVLLRL